MSRQSKIRFTGVQKYQSIIFLSSESNCKSDYKSYDKSCFKFYDGDKKSFDDARKICQNDGGDLMVVDNQFKQGNIYKSTVSKHHQTQMSICFVSA